MAPEDAGIMKEHWLLLGHERRAAGSVLLYGPRVLCETHYEGKHLPPV